MNEEQIEALFRYTHLPEHLQEISKPFHDMAHDIVAQAPPSTEQTLALRKLWEVKNLVVWIASS